MRISDWSSDVCSSDLRRAPQPVGHRPAAAGVRGRGRLLGPVAGTRRTASAPAAGRPRVAPGPAPLWNAHRRAMGGTEPAAGPAVRSPLARPPRLGAGDAQGPALRLLRSLALAPHAAVNAAATPLAPAAQDHLVAPPPPPIPTWF